MIEGRELEFHAIVLAAGQSSRMGREKAGLPWIGGKLLLSWMVDVLSAAGWRTIAVVGPESWVHWNAALPAGCAVLNPDPSRGKTSSLACGAERVPPDAQWILISAVDQPRWPGLYHRLRREAGASSARIIIPGREGCRGHPVVVSGSLREEFFSLQESSQGLRGLLNNHGSEIHRLSENDPAESQWDLNTPSAYEEALSFFQRRFDQLPAISQ